jgi:hypothetical protein
MDKFLKRARGQKVAATEDEESIRDILDNLSDVESLADSSDCSEIAAIAASTSRVPLVMPETTLAQVLEQQKVLLEQLAALREQDF